MEKPCQVCGDPVTPVRRNDRKAFWYPRRCAKCSRIHQVERTSQKGMAHPRAKPLLSRRIHRVRNIEYWQIKVNSEGKWVYEHRYIMEQHLGRKLAKYEHVHHKDEDTLHNVIENFEIMIHGKHTAHHHSIHAWAIKFTCCVSCSTTSKRHISHGLCSTCYQRKRKDDLGFWA